MPILHILMVDEDEPEVQWAGLIANRLGNLWKLDAGEVWVFMHRHPPDHYGESGATVGARPVMVSVLKHSLGDVKARTEDAAAITRIVADVCGVLETHVHVIFEVPGAGRVAFGGKLAV